MNDLKTRQQSKNYLTEMMTSSLIEYWSQFHLSTLARLLLSWVPMVRRLGEISIDFETIGSFGSGSCSHEAALALLLSNTEVFCHDISSKYIPNQTKTLFDSCSRLHFIEGDCSKAITTQKFDFVFSIQTLEHIEDYFSALSLMANAVKPGGYLYVDTPHFNERPELETDIEYHRKLAWEKHEHYHLGFSRKATIERIQNLGYTIVSSGYYCYGKFDRMALEGIRCSLGKNPVKCTKDSIVETIALLDKSLELAEDFYRERFDDLDSLMLQKRECSAISILARKNPN
jgi:SAM-dependent methyltransferase